MSQSNSPIKDISLWQLFDRYQLVIPEIQRDYVWGDPERGKDVLDGVISTLLGKLKAFYVKEGAIQEKSERLKSGLCEILERIDCRVNDEHIGDVARNLAERDVQLGDGQMGFAYAYIPGYCNGVQQEVLPALLIDGQQRITTFFLIWLYLAARAGKMDEFVTALRLDGPQGMAFDFKVRPLARDFVSTLVRKVKEKGKGFDFSSIDDLVWVRTEHRNDSSIRAMIGTLRKWDAAWKKADLGPADIAYDFVAHHVRFWLYVMNETVQGERLYITMNGRGRNLSDGEIIRATVFRDAGVENATKVGKLFESINDFFWARRIKGCRDADKGVSKFLHWVYLLERWIAANGDDKSCAAADFAKRLQNDNPQDPFRPRPAMFGEKGITFDLLQSAFNGLKKLYDFAPTVSAGPYVSSVDYLRASVLEDDDEPKKTSFQMDCFVLLPLLAWINALKGRQPVNEDDATRFARYLRKLTTKRDVGRSPATAVPHALGLAVAFAESQKDFLAFLGESDSEKFTQDVLPDEERGKANRLLSIRGDQKLYAEFVNLLDAVEDFKSKAGKGDEFSEDYRISAFLQLKGTSWWECDWNENLLKFYQQSFDRIKNFWKRDPLRRLRFLMMPEFGGYYETNKKLWPYSRSEIMGDLGKLRKIIAFEQHVEDVGEQKAFDESEQDYLNKHWNTLGTESDVRTLCALGLIVQCRLGKAIDPNLTQKIQFEESYYEGKKNVVNPQGVFLLGKYYFWFQGAEAGKWLYSAAKKERLFHANQVCLNDLTAQLNVQTAVSPMDVPPVK